MPELGTAELPVDPRRELYLERFREALTAALASLDARDHSRLRLYYVKDRTLAEIGKVLGEHEASVSRNLERIRKEMRSAVEGLLRAGKGAAAAPTKNGLRSGMDGGAPRGSTGRTSAH